MNKDQVMSLIRSALLFAGAYLVKKGLTDQSGLEEIVAGLLGIVSIAWSQVHHSDANTATPARLLPIGLLLGVLTFGLTACVTTPGPNGTSTTTLDMPAVTNAITLAVPPAVRVAVAKEPKCAQFLADAALAINLVAGGADQSPDALRRAIANAARSTGVNELTTPEAQAALDAGVALYADLYQKSVQAGVANANAWLTPVLQSLGNAIEAGLAPQP